MSKLAVHGGTPYRKRPFSERTPFGDKEVELVTEAIRSQNLFGLGGEKVTAFEKKFAEMYGVKYAVASTSGTAAIHIAIGGINPNPGDEIISAPITDGGAIVPVLYQNGIPIFADIDNTYNMDPAEVERNITKRTKAIVTVHIFGNACNMDAMVEISKKYNIPLIEDVSQAHATKYKDKYLGTIGDIGCFSLQQGKHMTTGDGGVTITNNDKLAERMRLFRDKGWTRKPGWGPRTYLFLAPNYRMTELQGAVGIAQLEKVKDRVKKRNELGTLLTSLIHEIDGLISPPVTGGTEHAYWLYPLLVTKWPVKKFADALVAEGVPCSSGYIGEPIFLCMEALARKKTFGTSHFPFDSPYTDRKIEYTKGMCPKTEEALHRMIILSIHEDLTREDILDMAGAIHKVAEGNISQNRKLNIEKQKRRD
jgi:dTDP-4-amino-4,6-dideoxygalactose transaminase